MSFLWISLGLGMIAGVANLFGGAIVSARPWSRTFLAYFIALGSGFMLATALTEMVPESLRLAKAAAPILILLGYFIVHIFEHSWPAHFHFGEETHADEFLNPSVAYTALGGLTIHTFFDGVSIASGFLVSPWLGTVIFGAVILHNIPEGFTIASVMTAAGKTRNAGMWAAGVLGILSNSGRPGHGARPPLRELWPGALGGGHALRGRLGPHSGSQQEPGAQDCFNRGGGGCARNPIAAGAPRLLGRLMRHDKS